MLLWKKFWTPKTLTTYSFVWINPHVLHVTKLIWEVRKPETGQQFWEEAS